MLTSHILMVLSLDPERRKGPGFPLFLFCKIDTHKISQREVEHTVLTLIFVCTKPFVAKSDLRTASLSEPWSLNPDEAMKVSLYKAHKLNRNIESWWRPELTVCHTPTDLPPYHTLWFSKYNYSTANADANNVCNPLWKNIFYHLVSYRISQVGVSLHKRNNTTFI